MDSPGATDAGIGAGIVSTCDAYLACDPSFDHARCLTASRAYLDRVRASGAPLCDELAAAQLAVWLCIAALPCSQLLDRDLDGRALCPAEVAAYQAAIAAGAGPCLDGLPPTEVPAGWVCDEGSVGDGWCDCGCGAVDPDCAAGTGCTSAGCRAQGCEFCADDERRLRFCFDFCGACRSDADCPVGVCVPDPDGPGSGYCTASCDLVSCGPSGEYCGADGNCLTAIIPHEVCAEDLTRGGLIDLCGNFLAPRACAANEHCAVVVGSDPQRITCQANYPDGTPSDDARRCRGGRTAWFTAEPGLTFCSTRCATSAECDPGTHCSASGNCVPVLRYACGPDRSIRYTRDSFGTDYPSLAAACPTGTNCVDAIEAGGSATCQMLRGDGQDCTSGSACTGGHCRSTSDAPSAMFCTRPCTSDAGCIYSMTCAGGYCVPRRSEGCSSDHRQRVNRDAFGRTYGV